MLCIKYTDTEGFSGCQIIEAASGHRIDNYLDDKIFPNVASLQIDSSLSKHNASVIASLMRQNKNIKKLTVSATDDYNLTLCDFPSVEHLMIFGLARIRSGIILAQILDDITDYISKSGAGIVSVYLDIVYGAFAASWRLVDAIGNLSTLRKLHINVYSHNNLITQILKKNRNITSILIDVETKNPATDELVRTLSTYDQLRCIEINRCVSFSRWKKLADVLPTTVNTVKYHHSFDEESDKILADILLRKHVTTVLSNTCSNETFIEVLKTDHVIKYITDNTQVHIHGFPEQAKQITDLLKTNKTLIYCSVKNEYGLVIEHHRYTNGQFVKHELISMAVPLIQQRILDLYVIKHIYDFINNYSHELNQYTLMQTLEQLRASVYRIKNINIDS